MAQNKDVRSAQLSLTSAPPPARDRVRLGLVGAGLSGVWGLMSVTALLMSGADAPAALRLPVALLVVLLPLALIWGTVLILRTTRMLQDDVAQMHRTVQALHATYTSDAHARGSDEAQSPVILKKLDAIVEAQKKAETTLAMFTSTRAAQIAVHAATPEPEPGDQPALALGTPAEALTPPLSNADLIRALHFPETADDTEGFAALRRALSNRPSAQLVQAAQDVLTLLSQDGIYMDDLRPDMARPDVWRRFAKGERGRMIAALGGVRDRSSLALTAGRMKQDPIFRDAAHHFLRLFDKGFAQFEGNATDAEISDLANTRTARAFMLLGRVTGTFD